MGVCSQSVDMEPVFVDIPSYVTIPMVLAEFGQDAMKAPLPRYVPRFESANRDSQPPLLTQARIKTSAFISSSSQGSQFTEKGSDYEDRKGRWWTQYDPSNICPLTQFPISLLPYPPFKFRHQPQSPLEFWLVDGKAMVMQLIVSSELTIGDRTLVESDVRALDDYMHRCKLGPLRVGRAEQIKMAIAKAADLIDAEKWEKELAIIRTRAREELHKLLCIQKKRLGTLTIKNQVRKHALPVPVGRVKTSGVEGKDGKPKVGRIVNSMPGDCYEM